MTTNSHHVTDGLRTREVFEVDSPEQIVNDIPITPEAVGVTLETRQGIHKILSGDDQRLIAIVGPCSIHDPDAALEYAGRLMKVKQQLADALLVVMRVYFEKPRTTDGLRTARNLLMEINSLGMPAGTEYLDLISPQYVSDLVSWGAIGARTTESQCHREMASGLSCPVGFKNDSRTVLTEI